MKAHDDPDSAGMSDLKAQDPDAFAIVQALLEKHTEHKSFSEEAAAAGITADDGAIEVPEAATPGSASNPSPDVGMPVMHHNPWAWKPGQNNDDALVANVLGQVASLKEGAGGSSAPSTEGSMLSDSSSLSSVS